MAHGADGSVLDVGRRTRTVPPALRRALAHRDAGCRFPGCGLKLCDAHHVEHWADGGSTKLDNLVQLCRRHHRAVHEEGFAVELTAGGEARFRRPGGRVIEEAPALPAIGGHALDGLLRRLARESIQVNAAASLPTWEGGPVDYNVAAQSLRGLEAASAPLSRLPSPDRSFDRLQPANEPATSTARQPSPPAATACWCPSRSCRCRIARDAERRCRRALGRSE